MSVIAFGVLWSILALLSAAQNAQPPNIVLILADDMGWNDVSFHGADQIPTPNIDALAYNGIILNQHYTPALCTPSRAALLTGKYPIHTGMQHLVILESEPWGLGLRERILPEALSRAGYRSHAIGKWHLGFYKKEYTPTYRGFDSHYGYWQGFHDYYNHSVRATYEPYDGYDMRRNLDVDWSSHGKYSTDLFTEEAVKLIKDHDVKEPLFLYLAHLAPHTGNMRDPFQAPDQVVAKFSHIQDPERRTYAAMVSKLDESVGEVVTALRQKRMLDNSIIIFLSDNGAPTIGIHSNRGSNYPFRGIKNSAWEGGNRGVAAVWSPLLKNQKRVSNQLMYITDWLPTLCSAAGLDPKDLGNIDGVDMWQVLSEGGQSPRNEILYNIDDIGNPYSALRVGEWKYVKGSATGPHLSEWYGQSGRDSGIGYNTNSIMMSKAGVAISAFVIKNQIQQKIKQTNQENSALDKEEIRHWSLLTEKDILKLRKEAEIECPVFNMTDLTTECRPLEEPCLFNLELDPCEKVNLAYQHPEILEQLENAVQRFRQSVVPARNQPSDPTADPHFWNNTWSSWQDETSLDVDLFQLGVDTTTIIWATVFVFCLVLLSVVLPFVLPSKKVEPHNPRPEKFLSIFSLDPPGQNKDMSSNQK